MCVCVCVCVCVCGGGKEREVVGEGGGEREGNSSYICLLLYSQSVRTSCQKGNVTGKVMLAPRYVYGHPSQGG